jgi:Tol biopolymer transport system component
MIGKQLAQYEILEKLGEGGMGEVWKARDTSLDREVAIKVLPEVFARDTERLARFEREAKLLASLNHPGIAVVHGLHEEEGLRFLAMELVPGENLAQRLSRGPLPVEEGLFVGVQVAEALEAAHAQGVIHRDLKPANIVLTPDGKTKVLDFGLAKASEPSGSSSSSLSPTVTSAGTVKGMILGTAAYMSPEQARGKPLDRRTDIWSFGCVLFECLAGGSLYKGESVSDSLGAILHKEPDWSLLPPDTPPTVRLLLRRCLTKDAERRLHDVADARIELEQAIEDPQGSLIGLTDSVPGVSAGRRGTMARPWALGAAALLALAAGLLGGWAMRGEAPGAPLRKLDLGVEILHGAGEAPETAISPDGAQVAYTLQGALWVQPLDGFESRPIDGVENALAPFWSPDGNEIGYFANGKLWKVAAVGGRAVAICDLGGAVAGGRGASWGEGGRIVFSRGSTGLLEVPALGGEAREILALAENDGDFHEPHLLPNGKGILFVVHPSDRAPGVLSLFDGRERRELLELEGQRIWFPVYAPSGHILFRRSGGEVTAGLWAIPFSLGDLQVEGEPFLVVPDAAAGSVSRDGTLAFVHRPPSVAGDRLVWVDRTGQRLDDVGGDRRGSGNPTLSPNGHSLAFGMRDEEDDGYDLWVRDLERGTETRLTVEEGFEFGFLWTPSGDEIVFTRFNNGVLSTHVVPANGSGPPRKLEQGSVVSCLTPDGGSMVVVQPPEGEQLSLTSNADLWLVSLSDADEPRPLIEGPDRTTTAEISPDGRWLAYQSERSGREQIFLTRFPEATGRWQVSVGEGDDPQWDPRGNRLYFTEGTTLMEVSVESGPEPRLGKPIAMFDLTDNPQFDPRGFTVSPDGDRFIIAEPAEDEGDEGARSGIKVVQNWVREFER